MITTHSLYTLIFHIMLLLHPGTPARNGCTPLLIDNDFEQMKRHVFSENERPFRLSDDRRPQAHLLLRSGILWNTFFIDNDDRTQTKT